MRRGLACRVEHQRIIMKRLCPRPRKKLLLKLGVFLLLGVVVNVAVAWGCAMWSPLLSCEPVDETRRAATLRQLAHLDQNDVIVEEACGVGWKQILVDHFGIDDQPATRNGDA
jgi:hypothetical protein